MTVRRFAGRLAVGGVIAMVNLGLVPAPLSAAPAHDDAPPAAPVSPPTRAGG